ncbi:unnamed protein product, partial [Protopolystoma xenopodis]
MAPNGGAIWTDLQKIPTTECLAKNPSLLPIPLLPGDFVHVVTAEPGLSLQHAGQQPITWTTKII